ncbi:membrane protein [Actinomadura sp. NBRC 104412]|uniref:lysylphosphatidylglycerol synthase transmembrane domain-containing protein n=1 Tax=Actinomadura sp. NBRC 104412 TaxID=3032203 RepID=UPI0024A31271|nr:lysylphosphatidylglycerol synthase transmembrane domain-containing protein [Actinomadura sp. NBRC 104412]GLZ03903.1 membrane protein [Actinomadura sp. NBRC 104412]
MRSKAILVRGLRVLLVLLALGFCVYSVAAQWEETVRAFRALSWATLVGAFAVACAGSFVWMLGWRAFLAGLGSPLPVRATFRISAISQLGKYVPGKVWALLTQIEMTREYKVPRLRSFSSQMLAIATSCAAGLALAAVTLPLTSDAARDRYWWLFALAPVLLVALHPRIVTWCLDTALKLVKRPPLEHPVSLGRTLVAVGWTMLGWVVYGVHLWMLCAAVGGKGAGLPFQAAGAYALAFVVGLLVFIAPGGIGAREAVLVMVLSPVLPTGGPILVALSSRVLLTLADLGLAGVAFLMGRNRRPVQDEGVQAEEQVSAPQ